MCYDEWSVENPHRVIHDFGPVESVKLDPVDAVTVTTLVDNAVDPLMPDQGPARREALRMTPSMPCSVMTDREVPDGLIAEHGFSALVTVTKGGSDHRVLFDIGGTPTGVVDNMRRLEIDPADIGAIVCSHGHFDHTAGLAGLARAVGHRNLPLVVHPHCWRRRRQAFPGRDPMELPTLSRSSLRAAGMEIVETAQPSFLIDGAVLITGEVPRVTGYEPGIPIQQAWLNDAWEPDPLVLDDQALIVNVRDKGLVVLTGCGHAGIVNIGRYATLLTGEPVHALVGGFHLNGPMFEPIIPRVLKDLAALEPAALVPAHCTGWRAQHAMATHFGDVFVPNAVGTRLHF